MSNSTTFGAAPRVPTLVQPGMRARPGLVLRLRTRARRGWLDRQIARGIVRTDDRALALREAQLASSPERHRLAARLERVLEERSPPGAFSSAVPIDRRPVEVASPVLTEVIASLRSSDPVEPRGVVLGWRLLTDPLSPIYARSGGPPGEPDALWYTALTLLFALRPLPSSPTREQAPA